jgi:methyl-accepting chemotaxis protein
MDDRTVELLETSFAALAPHGDSLVHDFYTRLFAAHPEVRPLFKDDNSAQERALLGALVTTVNNLRKPDVLVPVLKDMGKRHVAYGVQDAHYGVVRDTMLESMEHVAGELWNDDLKAAWTGALNLVAETMIAGAHEE